MPKGVCVQDVCNFSGDANNYLQLANQRQLLTAADQNINIVCVKILARVFLSKTAGKGTAKNLFSLSEITQ